MIDESLFPIRKKLFFLCVYFRVLAPPTPDTMTATHAIQPIIIIKESAYIVKNFIWKLEQKPLGMIKG